MTVYPPSNGQTPRMTVHRPTPYKGDGQLYGRYGGCWTVVESILALKPGAGLSWPRGRGRDRDQRAKHSGQQGDNAKSPAVPRGRFVLSRAVRAASKVDSYGA